MLQESIFLHEDLYFEYITKMFEETETEEDRVQADRKEDGHSMLMAAVRAGASSLAPPVSVWLNMPVRESQKINLNNRSGHANRFYSFFPQIFKSYQHHKFAVRVCVRDTSE